MRLNLRLAMRAGAIVGALICSIARAQYIDFNGLDPAGTISATDQFMCNQPSILDPGGQRNHKCTALQLSAYIASVGGWPSGALPSANFPALTGDVTTTAASLATTVGKINGASVPTLSSLLGSNSSGQLVAATNGNLAGGLNSDNKSTFSITGQQTATGAAGIGLYLTETFTPNGATAVDAAQLNPFLGNANGTNIGNFEGIFVASMTINAGYAGTTPAITWFESCNIYTDNRTGGTAANPASNFYCYSADPITNAIGATTGTASNYQFHAASTTASAASGGTVNNAAYQAVMPSGGSTGGTTNNYGLLISGNGGVNGSGTTNNYGIYYSGTADSQLLGGLDNTPIGLVTPLAGKFTTVTPNVGGYVHGTYTVCNTTGSNSSGVPLFTSTAASETNLVSCNIPAAGWPTGSQLAVTAIWYRCETTGTCGSGTDSFTYSIRVGSSAAVTGGDQILSDAITTTTVVYATTQSCLASIDSTHQMLYPKAGLCSGTGTAAPTIGTLNTANSQYVNFNCATATTADTCGIYSYLVQLIVP